MASSFQMTVTGEKELKEKFKKLENISESSKMYDAMISAANFVSGEAKKNLDRMVYNRPETTYHRTRGLFNRTQATGKVKKKTNEVISTVKSAVEYAAAVHLGIGSNKHIGPRPYLTEALQSKKDEILKLVKSIVEKEAK